MHFTEITSKVIIFLTFRFFFFFFPVDICVVKSFAHIMLELLSELLFIVYKYYYYYFSFFSSLNKRFPSIIKQAGLIFLYNCNYNNCYCNCECLVYIYSLVAFNVYTLKNDKKKLQIKKKKKKDGITFS